jgi:hypothetical protein
MRETRPDNRSAGWRDIFRVFRMSCDPARLRLGFLAVVICFVELALAGLVLVEVQHLRGSMNCRRIRREILRRDHAAALDAARDALGAAASSARDEAARIGDSALSPTLAPALREARTLHEIGVAAVVLVALLWLPWCYCTGSINRSAAVQYATGRRIRACDARRYAASRFGAYFWPPVALVLLVGALAGIGSLIALAAAHLAASVVATVGGILTLYVYVYVKQRTLTTAWGRIAALPVLVGTVAGVYYLWSWTPGWLERAGQLVLIVAFPVLIVLGLLAVLLLAVLVFGRGLMAAATSYESTGALDAITRAGDYLRRRPWQYIAYGLLAKGYGLACGAGVVLLAAAAFLLASLVAWAGFGGDFADVHGSLLSGGRGEYGFELARRGLMNAVFLALASLVAGWAVAFAHSYWPVCYALLRRQVDGAAPAEICIDPGEGERR